jgi:urate oxidase
MVRLGPNRYGKAEVRLVRVARGAAPGGGDLLRDWNVSTSLSGDLAAASLAGDNSHVLPTDSQKNKVYALARELGGVVEPEAFGLALASYLVTSQEPVTRARVAIEEYGWSPAAGTGFSFTRSGDLVRTTVVVADSGTGATVVSGLRDLVVLNTTASEFWGFARDAYTTLPETRDRILATAVSAQWRYRPDAVSPAAGTSWAGAFDAAKTALVSAFAGTYSYSLQQTLYAMGSAVLAAVPAACEVRLALPNKHHYLVDLSPFGLENPGEVYNAGDRPYGLIEGHVLADDAPEPGPAWT